MFSAFYQRRDKQTLNIASLKTFVSRSAVQFTPFRTVLYVKGSMYERYSEEKMMNRIKKGFALACVFVRLRFAIVE